MQLMLIGHCSEHLLCLELSSAGNSLRTMMWLQNDSAEGEVVLGIYQVQLPKDGGLRM